MTHFVFDAVLGACAVLLGIVIIWASALDAEYKRRGEERERERSKFEKMLNDLNDEEAPKAAWWDK